MTNISYGKKKIMDKDMYLSDNESKPVIVEDTLIRNKKHKEYCKRRIKQAEILKWWPEVTKWEHLLTLTAKQYDVWWDNWLEETNYRGITNAEMLAELEDGHEKMFHSFEKGDK